MKKSTKITLAAALALACVGGGVGVMNSQVQASAEEKPLEFTFALPYQNAGWGLTANDNIVALGIKGLEAANLKTGNYTIKAKDGANNSLIYVSDDVSSEGSVKLNGGVYGVDNRGGNGWAVINLNLKKDEANYAYKRVTIKKSFAITVGSDTYTLAEDYSLYHVNGSYIPGKTWEEAVALLDESKLNVIEKDIVKIEADGFTYDSAYAPYGCAGYADWDMITGSKGGKFNVYGVQFGAKAKGNFGISSHSFVEGETVTVPAGFRVAFWNDAKTGVDVITTTKEFKAIYTGGEFTDVNSFTRAEYIAAAQASNTYFKSNISFAATKSGWMNRGDKAFTYVYENEEILKKVASGFNAEYSYISNIGYVEINDTLITDKSMKQFTRRDNGNLVKDAKVLGVDFSNLVGADVTPKKVTLKKGFLAVVPVEKSYLAVELENDFTLYNVDGYWLPVQSIDELATTTFKGLSFYEKSFMIDAYDIKDQPINNDCGVEMLIANWESAPYKPDKTTYPEGGGTWFDQSYIEINGEALDTEAWYFQYAGDSGFKICSAKDAHLPSLTPGKIELPDGEEFGTITFKKGMRLVFVSYTKMELEIWTLDNDYTGWFNAEGMAFIEDPNGGEELPDLDSSEPSSSATTSSSGKDSDESSTSSSAKDSSTTSSSNKNSATSSGANKNSANSNNNNNNNNPVGVGCFGSASIGGVLATLAVAAAGLFIKRKHD